MEVKRLLIVGTVPYKKNAPSRAFESYFSNWPRQSIAQIFSNPQQPFKGHCNTLFQVTDKMLLKRWFNSKSHVGKAYYFDKLTVEDSRAPLKDQTDSIISKLYSAGAKKTPLIHLLRALLWKKNFWCTDELNTWLEQFNPECLFLSFSDDFFILDIAIYVAEKFGIPIVSTVGDDYYFNDRKSISPLYYIYRAKYKKLVNKIFKKYKYAIYISDKIRDKYNGYFGLKGETVYLTSEFERRNFRSININNPKIRYFGNITLDRHLSIIDVAKVLRNINPQYRVDVYSGLITDDIKAKFDSCGNIVYHNAIPYAQVKELTSDSDILLVVEGFTEHNINSTRYSLSTKAADSLQSGVNVFAYGSKECGLIDYLLKYDACVVCIDKEELKTSLLDLIKNEEVQKKYYDKSIEIVRNHHNIETSTGITRSIINQAIEDWTKTH